MGCITTKNLENVFKISESQFGNGRLHITSKELIFYTKDRKHDPIVWPLKHLRRYGVDLQANIFSIEAGRKCQTGQGMLH